MVGVPIGEASGHPRHKVHERIRRGGNEGEVSKLARQERPADGGRIRLHELRSRGDLHRLHHCAHFQHNVLANGLAGEKSNAAELGGLESLVGDVDLVSPGQKVGNRVGSGSVRRRLHRDAGPLIRH